MINRSKYLRNKLSRIFVSGLVAVIVQMAGLFLDAAHCALVRTDLGGFVSADVYGTASFATSSFTPPANSLLVVVVAMMSNNLTGDLGTPTISGGSLTYSLLGSARGESAFAIRTNIFTAPVGASPSAMTITVDDDNNQDITSYVVEVIAYTGYDTTTPTAGYVTSGTTDIGNGAETQTLAATPTNNDVSLSVISIDLSSGAYAAATMDTGWTEVYSTHGGDGYMNATLSERLSSTSTAVSLLDSYPGAGSFLKAAMLSFIVKSSPEIYRSVGTTATNLNTAGRTVTISGTTATFNRGMPDNVGVGDALVYGANIAFISGRTSSTVYSVQSGSGGVPATASAGTAVSVYRCYSSLRNWERNILGNENPNIPAAVDDYVILSSTDLVTDGRIMMVPCYADGVDTTQFTLDGWTTGSNNYIKIYTPVSSSEVGVSQRHTGKWGDGYQKDDYLIISEEYVRVDGLSIKQEQGNRTFFINNSTGAGEIHISNCFGWYTYTQSYDVFDVFTVGALVVKFWNCIGISDSTNTTSDAFYFNDVDATIYCYNCTGIANAGRAFRSDFSTAPAVLKNCLGFSTSSAAFSGSFTSVTYSASDDDTADNWTGTGSRIDQVFSFIDAAGQNFHLSSADAGAKEFGTSLVTDPTIPFAVDIDGDSRPINSFWDIGADEVGGGVLYRSVGTNAADLKTTGATVGISGTTATFSLAMPDNVGVGDAVVYGSTYIAFISGRTSSTVYTVQSATGGAPTEVAAGTSVAVYRCYQSLYAWERNELDQENINISTAVDDGVILSSTDLVASGNVMKVPCYADGEDSTERVEVDGWTTGPDNYIQIYTPVATTEVGASQRHTGKWGDGYRMSKALVLREEYMRIDGLSVKQTGADRIYLVNGSTGVGAVLISNCFGWYTTDNNVFDVFDVWQAGDLVVKFWNCIGISDSTAVDSDAFYSNDASSTVYFYNCTGYANGGRAFSYSQGVAHCKNCLGYSVSGNAFNAAFSSITYSASDDLTADDMGGLGNRISQTFSFVDSANQNLHLLSTDAGAINFGTTLLSDPIIPFNTDIDGNGRPIGAAWDIGADEAFPSAGLLKSSVITSD